jgi:Protein of unknown function (DUF2946)
MGKARFRLRPWVALVAAYALALQVVFSGVVATRLMAADGAAAGAQFAICHSGNGSADDGPGGTDAPPQAHCLLCVLAGASAAILPAAQVGGILVVEPVSRVVAGKTDRIIEYHSPTGQYQRGPPASAGIVG